MVASPPFSTGYALFACIRARARIAARVGLALAAAELLFVVVLMIQDLLSGGGADRRLRSCTPAGAEVFGAGHNALGAWWWLAESGELPLGSGGGRFAQEIGERVLPVEVIAEGGRPVAVAMTQAPPVRGRIV